MLVLLVLICPLMARLVQLSILLTSDLMTGVLVMKEVDLAVLHNPFHHHWSGRCTCRVQARSSLTFGKWEARLRWLHQVEYHPLTLSIYPDRLRNPQQLLFVPAVDQIPPPAVRRIQAPAVHLIQAPAVHLIQAPAVHPFLIRATRSSVPEHCCVWMYCLSMSCCSTT